MVQWLAANSGACNFVSAGRASLIVILIFSVSSESQASGILPVVIGYEGVQFSTPQAACESVPSSVVQQYIQPATQVFLGFDVWSDVSNSMVHSAVPYYSDGFEGWLCIWRIQTTVSGQTSVENRWMNWVYPVCPPSFAPGTYRINGIGPGAGLYCPSTPTFYTAASPKKILPAENGGACQKKTNTAIPPMSHCGDPINPASGNTFNSEQDLSANDLSSISFSRYYNSNDMSQNPLGAGWRDSFSRFIKAIANIASFQPLSDAGSTYSSLYSDEALACTSGFAQIQPQVPSWSGAVASFSNGVCNLSKGGVYAGSLPIYSAYDYNIAPETSPPNFDYTSDSGQITRFSVINGLITAPPGYGLKLVKTTGGYTLTDGNDNVESYDSSGKLLSVTSRSGVVQTMSYDNAGRLVGVADNFGHQLMLDYDFQNRLISVTRQ